MSDKTGRLFVVSGPSGAGIGDVMKKTIESREDIGFIIPVTARKMKAGEENGVGFYFYDLEGWDALKAEGDLLECTEFAGNDYGTSRRQVNEQTAQGKNVLLNLELSRASQIKKNMPEAVCVFMIPQSREELEKRYQATARNRFEVPRSVTISSTATIWMRQPENCLRSWMRNPTPLQPMQRSWKN